MKMASVCFLLFAVSVSVPAQPDAQWYVHNDRGNRYEGSYTRKVSNPSLSLVGLTTPLPAYAFGQRQQLQVQFYVPAEMPYNLHAEELQIRQFYWLEDKNKTARAGWNPFDDWHVDYMLDRLSIDHRNLGLLVRLGERGTRQYAPAFVRLAGQPVNPRLYIAQLRLGRPAAGGSFSLYRGQSKAADRLLRTQPISRKSSGTVFPVVIPIEWLGEQAAWFTLELHLREERTGDPFTYSFSFYHPATPTEP